MVDIPQSLSRILGEIPKNLKDNWRLDREGDIYRLSHPLFNGKSSLKGKFLEAGLQVLGEKITPRYVDLRTQIPRIYTILSSANSQLLNNRSKYQTFGGTKKLVKFSSEKIFIFNKVCTLHLLHTIREIRFSRTPISRSS